MQQLVQQCGPCASAGPECKHVRVCVHVHERLPHAHGCTFLVLHLHLLLSRACCGTRHCLSLLAAQTTRPAQSGGALQPGCLLLAGPAACLGCCPGPSFWCHWETLSPLAFTWVAHAWTDPNSGTFHWSRSGRANPRSIPSQSQVGLAPSPSLPPNPWTRSLPFPSPFPSPSPSSLTATVILPSLSPHLSATVTLTLTAACPPCCRR